MAPPSYFEPYRIPNISRNDQINYLPERCGQECIRFIEANQDKPFFLCWWNYSVHYPFQAPEPLVQKYEKRKGPGIENPTYAAMIEGMDQSIGKLLKSLDRLKLAENTMIIFTSDNGPFAANVKPLRGEKGYLYEGGIRVPAIVKWPGKVKPNTVSKTPIISMDFHATILDAVGIAADPSNHPDGDSLTDLLTGTSSLNRDAIYFHYPNYAFHKKNRPGSAIRCGDYKLIKFYDDNSVELYNLKEDLSESNDLSKSMPNKTMELKNKLEAWISETDAKTPANAN
ncbi:sulfatase-like hydrolase/transferase [bacterium]|nr:sulfatase-like hydrolase/transferase [bacterium]